MAQSLGTTSVTARVAGVSCTSGVGTCAQLTVAQIDPPPPPPPACATITLSLKKNSLPVTEVQVEGIDRATGETFGPFPVPFGAIQEAGGGSFELHFSSPDGKVAPHKRKLKLECGDHVEIDLKVH
jgi:hypothetical protein